MLHRMKIAWPINKGSNRAPFVRLIAMPTSEYPSQPPTWSVQYLRMAQSSLRFAPAPQECDGRRTDVVERYDLVTSSSDERTVQHGLDRGRIGWPICARQPVRRGSAHARRPVANSG